MLVNSITNFKYDMSNKLANRNQDAPAPQPQPVKDEGLTASIYFTGKKNKNAMRNATMATIGSLALVSMLPSMSSCSKDDWYGTKSESYSSSYSESNAKTSDTTTVILNTHPRGCDCDCCKKGKDTVYVNVPGPTEYVHDTIHHHDTTYIHDSIPKEIPIYIYVDTGSYHVDHDTIIKWKDNYEKPIPLDTLDKISNKFDIDGVDPSRKNIVSYQGVREWEYGNRFATVMNQLQSSKYNLVYDREDFDWEGNHTGWGKDVFRYPRTDFKIQTYSGQTLRNPKGLFVETYKNPFDSKISDIADNELISRRFIQTKGDSVYVFTYDKNTGLYREDGRLSKGYLENSSILFTDLIASDPDKIFGTDPEYSTEDHLVKCKIITVNDEELKDLYVRAKDDDVAEQLYGVANNAGTRSDSFAPWNKK